MRSCQADPIENMGLCQWLSPYFHMKQGYWNDGFWGILQLPFHRCPEVQILQWEQQKEDGF